MFDNLSGAFNSVSFDPDRRFNSFCKDYTKEEKRIIAAGEKYGIDPTYYLDKYRDLATRYLGSISRCASAGIVGFSKFPVERMQKRHRWAEAWLSKFCTYPDYAIRKIKKRATPKVSQSEKANMWEIRADKLEDNQNFMKKINKLLRKGDIQAVVDLVGEQRAEELQKPDFAGRIGFPDYTLTNNLANIKRLRKQAEKVNRMQSLDPTKIDFEFDGGSVKYDAEEIRFNIYFDEIPAEEVRSKLKRYGFRWSPRRKAWTRGAKSICASTIKSYVLGLE